MAKSRPSTRPDEVMFRAGTGAFALVLVIGVLAIGFELYRQSRLSLHEFGWQFWQTDRWDPIAGQFGARPFIWGTLYSSVLAILISTPIALGIAIYISELAPSWSRAPLVFLTELLAAALILAIMIIPFSSSIAREVLKAVPQAQREGAYALGATRWEATRMALFYARTGVIGAIMLGFGRALGETMAVTMVIGNNPQITTSLYAPQYTMAAVLANEFTEATDNIYLSALVEIGLVLFVMTLIINVLSRLLIWSMTRPRQPKKLPSVALRAAA